MRHPLRVGLYSPFFGSTYGGGEKYLGVVAETLRDALPSATIELVSPSPVDVDRYERLLDLDLRGIQLRSTLGAPGPLARRLSRVKSLRRYRDLFVSARSAGQTASYDLFFSMVYVVPAFTRARRSVILCQFPYETDALRARRGLVGAVKRLYALPEQLLRPHLLGKGVDDFQLVVCQSEYVRRWVTRRWGRASEVVNPPIDIPEEEPDWDRKEQIVLSVGRFFARGHSKRQDLIVRAFRELCDAGLSGWELHLVGSLQRDHAEDVAYFDRVASLARGYPVTIHVDAPGPELASLYRRAAVYWHAAGFGVDEESRPDDLEHFGMTTAEAMGHGVVPLAIARGGQVEVVEAGVSGFLWSEVDQLKSYTLELAGDTELRRRLGVAARARSGRFARPVFRQRMLDAVTPLLVELGAMAEPAEERRVSPTPHA
jgi:glycosyltransferase involved in cell wall biosynthesis